MWCSDWAEILCGNVTWLECVVHVSLAFGTVIGDLSRTQRYWLVHFYRNFVWW